MYAARVLADSVNPAGIRLITVEATYPHIVHPHILTHRMFSRGTGSSRAIPARKLFAKTWRHPFLWGSYRAERQGMQAGAPVTGWRALAAGLAWRGGLVAACATAWIMARLGVHKEQANRPLEPWAWTTAIITATEWENFFALRLDEAAQPETRIAAATIHAAIAASTPRALRAGEWHTPYIGDEDSGLTHTQRIAVSVGRCARVSYLTHDLRRDPAADIRLCGALRTKGHMGPFEHVARAEDHAEPCGNFRGFTQFRKMLPGEAVFRHEASS